MKLVQLLVWAIFYVFVLLYTMQKWDQPLFSFAATTIATSFYLVAVYGNAIWLLPRYYSRNKFLYACMSAGLILILVTGRLWLEEIFLYPIHRNFYNWSVPHVAFAFITLALAFLFGGLLYITWHYVTLLQQQQELRSEKLAAEVNLLKAQVQPHFLFNTLNNIYSLAKLGSPKTADTIAALSSLMRYFIEQVPQERVKLSEEVNFIQHYIDLEKIRLANPLSIKMHIDETALSVHIPPMLLIPFIENVFKHGIDRMEKNNFIDICLQHESGIINYTVKNSVYQHTRKDDSGSGLKTLKRRLEYIFPGNHQLETTCTDHMFVATLIIPE